MDRNELRARLQRAWENHDRQGRVTITMADVRELVEVILSPALTHAALAGQADAGGQEAVAWLCDAQDGVNCDATASTFVRDTYAKTGRRITPLYAVPPDCVVHGCQRPDLTGADCRNGCALTPRATGGELREGCVVRFDADTVFAKMREVEPHWNAYGFSRERAVRIAIEACQSLAAAPAIAPAGCGKCGAMIAAGAHDERGACGPAAGNAVDGDMVMRACNAYDKACADAQHTADPAEYPAMHAALTAALTDAAQQDGAAPVFFVKSDGTLCEFPPPSDLPAASQPVTDGSWNGAEAEHPIHAAVLRMEDGAQAEVTARREVGKSDLYWLGKLSAFGEVAELFEEAAQEAAPMILDCNGGSPNGDHATPPVDKEADRYFISSPDSNVFGQLVVRATDYDRLSQQLAATIAEKDRAVSLLRRVKEDGNLYLMPEIDAAIAAGGKEKPECAWCALTGKPCSYCAYNRSNGHE